MKTIQEIELSHIVPDAVQPRRLFDAGKLAVLAKSIEKYGIKQPLTVQKMPGGKYLLVDGERRYRTAIQLKLKTVPALVEEQTTDSERLIEQFHLQEMHEGWTATEKAVAVSSLAKAMGESISSLSKTLGIPERTVSDYIAFAKLINKDYFQQSEISIRNARQIVNLNTRVKLAWSKYLDKEFTSEMQAHLEEVLVDKIKGGAITGTKDLLKISDAVGMQPEIITKFMKDGKMTADGVFIASNAKAERYHRQIMSMARIIPAMVASGSKIHLPELFLEEERPKLIQTQKAIETLLKSF